MKNLTALRFFVFLLFFFSLSPAIKAFAETQQFFSDNSWSVYGSDPNPSNLDFIGPAEELNWQFQTEYSGISTEAKWIWAPGIAGSYTPVDLTKYYFQKNFHIVPAQVASF